MMTTAYILACILGILPFIPDMTWTHKKRLSIIFRRKNFLREYRDLYGNLKEAQPKYLGVTKAHNYVEYTYSIPLGHVLSEELTKAIEEAFDVPVVAKSEGGRLYIRFYLDNLPDQIPYDLIPTNAKPSEVPIGVSLDGFRFHDFDVTPHMTVAGATRQGKTVFLKNVLTYLCENNQPDDLRFYMIDLKGGLEFGRYANLTQVKSVAGSPEEAAELFRLLLAEIDDSMADFRRKGYTNIVHQPEEKRRTFIIIDEAAELTPEKWMPKESKEALEYAQSAMARITRIAGALGYRLIHATQYPTGDTLPRAVKQNADAKLAFRLPTELASRVAIDEGGAEYLPNPGRGIYRTIDKIEVQVPYLSDDEMHDRLTKYIRKGDENGRNTGEAISTTNARDFIRIE